MATIAIKPDGVLSAKNKHHVEQEVLRSRCLNKADSPSFLLSRFQILESEKMSVFRSSSISESASGYSLETSEPSEDLYLQHKDTYSLLNKTGASSSIDRNFLLFRKPLYRWLGTVAFIVAIITTLLSYQRKGNYSSAQKQLFVVIKTALVLGLGLNFFVRSSFLQVRIVAYSFSGRIQRIS